MFGDRTETTGNGDHVYTLHKPLLISSQFSRSAVLTFCCFSLPILMIYYPISWFLLWERKKPILNDFKPNHKQDVTETPILKTNPPYPGRPRYGSEPSRVRTSSGRTGFLHPQAHQRRPLPNRFPSNPRKDPTAPPRPSSPTWQAGTWFRETTT